MDLNVNDLSFTLMKRTFNIFEKKPVMARDTRFIPKSLYNLWKSDCAVSSWGPCTCLRTRSRTWNFVNLLARIYYSGWLVGWLAGWWKALQTKSTKIISNLIWICLVQAMLSFQMQSTTHVLAELRFGVLYWFIFHVQGWFILLYNLIMRHPLLDVLVLFFFFF